MSAHLPKKKVLVLVTIVVAWAVIGLGVKLLVELGELEPATETLLPNEDREAAEVASPANIQANLDVAIQFLDEKLVREDGHVNLYYLAENATFPDHDDTNSEAASYYLLIKANQKDKEAFDRELDFIEAYMIQPVFGYMQWRVEANKSIITDGGNIASDADLRAIKALLIAEEQWGDERYTEFIDMLAYGLEQTSITDDYLLAPYAGVAGETSIWKTQESWLSYQDFTVFAALAERRGEPWNLVYENMKEATLNAQIYNGLYNSQLTEKREYGNGIDGGSYSINSMWIMIRNAESDDRELRASAQKSIDFYKEKLLIDAQLFAQYASTGDALSPNDTPWAYALVGRAAINLNEKEMSDQIIQKLLAKQVQNPASELYGAFPEGSGESLRAGQFTLQETILTLQDYLAKQESGWEN